MNRREFLGASIAAPCMLRTRAPAAKKARIAITLDLEMSRHYPRRNMLEWDYQKGNLDEPTKRYSLQAARIVRDLGGVIHFFCVGRVLEQADIQWLKDIASLGHPVGNHTYDHVNVLAREAKETQFRFRRSPWLVDGRSAAQVIRENVRLTTLALRQRAGVEVNGFRTPGGFRTGLAGREDVQQLLRAEGFSWVSSKYPQHQTGTPRQRPTPAVLDDIVRAQSEAQPFVYPSGLIEVPMSPISDVNAFRSNFWKLDWFLGAIERSVRWAIDNRAVFDFLCHPSCMVVEDPQFETIKLICRLVRESGSKAELVGLDAIARSVTPA